MNENDLTLEKQGLVEELGVHLERENLAPVAARIFATLILTGQEGITFDQLVCDLHASKSTVSTHLEHLQTTGKVNYFTKPGDRKRYFVINKELILNEIDTMVAKFESDMKIHEKVLLYKEKRNEFNRNHESFHFDLELHNDFLTFLGEATSAIQKLKSTIQQKKHLTNYNN